MVVDITSFTLLLLRKSSHTNCNKFYKKRGLSSKSLFSAVRRKHQYYHSILAPQPSQLHQTSTHLPDVSNPSPSSGPTSSRLRGGALWAVGSRRWMNTVAGPAVWYQRKDKQNHEHEKNVQIAAVCAQNESLENRSEIQKNKTKRNKRQPCIFNTLVLEI